MVERVQWGDTVFLRRVQSLDRNAVEEMLVEVLRLANANGALLSGKGLCLFGLGRIDEALAAQSGSDRLAPDHTPATLGLTLCLAALERFEEAREAPARLQPPSVVTRALAVLQDQVQREALHALLAPVLPAPQ